VHAFAREDAILGRTALRRTLQGVLDDADLRVVVGEIRQAPNVSDAGLDVGDRSIHLADVLRRH
jgi:hypothetical protein